MLIHAVYFWLSPELDTDTLADFEKGLEKLSKIDTVRHGYWGRPAVTDRPVIDRTYTYGLVVIFDDMAGHDAYQIDPAHKAFLEQFSTKWMKVSIYDTET